jgi:hypothetical protein
MLPQRTVSARSRLHSPVSLGELIPRSPHDWRVAATVAPWRLGGIGSVTASLTTRCAVCHAARCDSILVIDLSVCRVCPHFAHNVLNVTDNLSKQQS